jgi:hypothetical protein
MQTVILIVKSNKAPGTFSFSPSKEVYMKNVSKLSALVITMQSRWLFLMMLFALAMPRGGLAAQSAAPSLDGVWQAEGGHTISINGAAAVAVRLSSSALWRDAVRKGYVKDGDLIFRNITSGSANLQWICQELAVEFRAVVPNTATGVRWEDRTITMNPGGQSFRIGSAATYYRTSAQPAAPPSINGVWESAWGHTISISGSIAVYMAISVQTRWQSGILKGFIQVGGQKLRNLVRTGDLTWAGQDLDLAYDTSDPDTATGVVWKNCIVQISADGQTLIIVTPEKDFPTVIYSRIQ